MSSWSVIPIFAAGWQLPGGGAGVAEPPCDAILRELKEEIGLVESGVPELLGLFTRKLGVVSNVIALYRVPGVVFAFKPNLEIREIVTIDPANPPPDTSPATRRRLAEFLGKATPSPYW